MPQLNINEIRSLKYARQYFHDCYLVSSLHALAQSSNGINLLQKNITRDGTNYNIQFDGLGKMFSVSQDEFDKLDFVDKYCNPKPPKEPYNPILQAIEIAMEKLIAAYPSKKSITCRLAQCRNKFEYNYPSNFLELFTNKKPHTINERSINMKLASKKEEAMDLFEKLDNSNSGNSFVVGTGIRLFSKLPDCHVFVLKKVDLKNNIIYILDNRVKKLIALSIEDALNNLKFITGYFNSDLK